MLTGSVGSVLLQKYGWESPFILIGVFSWLRIDCTDIDVAVVLSGLGAVLIFLIFYNLS